MLRPGTTHVSCVAVGNVNDNLLQKSNTIAHDNVLLSICANKLHTTQSNQRVIIHGSTKNNNSINGLRKHT